MGTLADIEHIVVIMLENRSFDHMLGYLTLNGRTDVDGLTGREHEIYDGEKYPVHPLESDWFMDDPGHAYTDVREQLDPRGGFVKNFASHCEIERVDAVMGYYDEYDVPAFDFLAREYAISDRWFSSVPGPTHPNRLFSLAGHSAGLTKNYLGLIGHYDMPTIFDFLGDEPTDWQFFYHDVPTLWFFEKYFLIKQGMIRKYGEFQQEVAAGRLAKVTWIDPHYGVVGRRKQALKNDDHPKIHVGKAQSLVADVYNTLAASDLWSSTLLVVSYDEHGGFYDHVAPPKSGDSKQKFRRLGVRVPTLVASPWTSPALCVGSPRAGRPEVVFDHTSILKTIFDRFIPDESPSLMSKRVARAQNLEIFLTEASARQNPALIPDFTVDPRSWATALPGTVLDAVGLDLAAPMVHAEEVDVSEAETLGEDVSFEESLRLLAFMALAGERDPEEL